VSPADRRISSVRCEVMATALRRVLVVDDDEAIRDLLDLALTEEGYSVRQATGGRHALSVARTWRPHLILLDVRMADLDEWGFLQEHRRDGISEAEILVLTAGTDAERRAEDFGVPVLLKPFDLDYLLDRVRDLIDESDRRVRGVIAATGPTLE
jgi:two-component system, OmpR family, response regulator